MISLKSATLALMPFAVMSLGCERQVSFRDDVHPMLEQNCVSCHSPGGQGYAASGFSVVSYQGVMKGTRYAAVVVPGDSAGSLLLRLIQHQSDPSIAMPKSHQQGAPADWLTPGQIALIATWIDQGAKDN